MHIPDNFLNTPTLVSTGVLSLGFLHQAIKKCRATMEEKNVPLLGVTSAFIFAAQMINFPVLAGTSGHLLGGVLAALILGPWMGSLAITSVLILQCLIYQDGGLLALTANTFNMAVLGTIICYTLIPFLISLKLPENAVIFMTAWFSVVLASAAAALELAFSGMAPLKLVLPAMAGIHALIGLGEGIITLTIWQIIKKWRPDLLYSGKKDVFV